MALPGVPCHFILLLGQSKIVLSNLIGDRDGSLTAGQWQAARAIHPLHKAFADRLDALPSTVE